jgi:hypothetical protein
MVSPISGATAENIYLSATGGDDVLGLLKAFSRLAAKERLKMAGPDSNSTDHWSSEVSSSRLVD